ncbi:MAG: hypothetical protein AAFU85_10880 [Planctomycetota bacterium]
MSQHLPGSDKQLRHVQFQAKQAGLSSLQVWEYDAGTKRVSHDVAGETARALQRPDDFPPMEAAIVPGDRVALAIDPNVPQIESVVSAALRLVDAADASHVDLVLWDEATDETAERLASIAPDGVVVRHQSDVRDSLSYLAADVDADPIYLNRAVVDADFVLPIVAIRPTDVAEKRDFSGIYPSLSDSATRNRFDERESAAVVPLGTTGSIAREVPWLLGVQLLLTVTANSDGRVGEVNAGTMEAIAKRVTPTLRRPDPVPPPASLVVAALDGDAQQQTWENVARAAQAAMAYAEPDATIVVWSTLDRQPGGSLLSLEDEVVSTGPIRAEADVLPKWDASRVMANRLKQVLAKHRVLLHSRLSRETIEPIGLGAIESAGELANLSRGFESCGVLRAAQFAGGN